VTLIEGLRSFLAATPAVTAITGSTNIFPNESLQAALAPRIVYKRSDELDDDTLDRGHTKSPTARLGLTCYGGRWGTGYASGRQLADAVLNADGGLGGLTLKSYRGLWGSVVIQSCRSEEDIDTEIAPVDGTGRGEQAVELTLAVASIEQ